ncbi:MULTISPECIES: 2-oxo-4-hydroxy-4-carboxy-5-ureidoimidazoline decarboxylase [unclassified Arthrobacter]|uniref:2-oxo-4-hydroxy-4-carboxy-5-ureidoimidazoline decarboxylase n=1 Tax=unclassified Arthrobacter TaxID=235627 RepID=UPI00159E1887|nr:MULTISPECIES: 2-oxo-4-hydroxy-4-carboxy-5-ureidoimidazoline decarboxylase [unclassified Arthrobacter]MCQ9165234.1 2-oxo-4-hydroxy-4-carboxy-5-ureidoimidazoline decarboxylase [Arthrobacter sp. STN4]NVM99570.1 2-oxo-4-hydroxy-4-carboxy-5-ureidoimidazoline decarboxylase [Arthrobacter sp. SDTb3-6]
MLLQQFNEADRAQLDATLRPCVDNQRWIDEIAAARPFTTLNELFSHALKAAAPFSGTEVAAAMAHHPRIGEQAAGNSAEARLSRREQSGVDPANAELARALAEGNRAYEEKFGQVFLIRAAGRTPQEILAALERRLANTAEEEAPIVAQQLREIAVLRLKGVMSQ